MLALVLALVVPATASAAATISVENGAIRFVGDETDNELDVYAVENGEQPVYVRWDTALGPGCHPREHDQTYTAPQGNASCSLVGVDRIEFVGGGGSDAFRTANLLAADIPVQADMGPGDDRFDLGSKQSDTVDAGAGLDDYVDGAGDDVVDLGDDADVARGGDFSTGNDTIRGGGGDDVLDGLSGDDVLDGGPGDDLLQPGDGNDTLIGGDDDDEVAGAGGGCLPDPGADIMSGGPGDDQLCGGPGVDWLDGGDGNDQINAVDGGADGPLACGDGFDAAWTDPFDHLPPDCELQDDQRVETLPAPNLVPVALPCATGACTGKVRIYAAPDAKRPAADATPPLTAPATNGKPLATAKFRLKARATRIVRIKLGKAAAKRLKKLGATTVEARTTFTQQGKTYSVRRTFGVKRK
jgi:RTX calcium-binding nonapeptide repeat (4 copies)